MISVADLDLNWEILGAAGKADTGIHVRKLSAQSGAMPVFQGMDHSGNRMLLFPISESATVSEDRESAGVQVIDLSLTEHATIQRFVAVQCLKAHLNTLFSIIVAEMIEEVEAELQGPDVSCRRVLERWREFLDPARYDRISDTKLIGILAELECLREIAVRTPRIVDFWTGPRGAQHDFSLPGLSLEVKATTIRHGLRLEIHGLEQLEEPEGGELYLAVFRLEPVLTGGLCLHSLINQIRDLGCNVRRVIKLLNDIGIVWHDQNDALHRQFGIVERRVYQVDSGFPRIVKPTLIGGKLPAGVVSINYTIDLTSGTPGELPEAQTSRLFDLIASGAQDADARTTI